MDGMSVFDEFVGGPAAELAHAAPAGSPAVVPCDREGDREPEPPILLVPEVADEHRGGTAREPGLHERERGTLAVVGVVRIQAAS
jgi:hypothetical protein